MVNSSTVSARKQVDQSSYRQESSCFTGIKNAASKAFKCLLDGLSSAKEGFLVRLGRLFNMNTADGSSANHPIELVALNTPKNRGIGRSPLNCCRNLFGGKDPSGCAPPIKVESDDEFEEEDANAEQEAYEKLNQGKV